MEFERFPKPLDPDEPIGQILSFPIELADGVTLTSAVVEVVDKTSTTVEDVPIVTISEVAPGQEEGNLWGVSCRAVGTGVSGRAYLRCRYVKSQGPQGKDLTGVLLIRQT